MSIGHKIIQELAKGGMFGTHDADGPISRPLIFVWSSGAAEQLDALVAQEALTPELREVLTGAQKWLRRIHDRKKDLPASFLDNCDPKPLADKISHLLAADDERRKT